LKLFVTFGDFRSEEEGGPQKNVHPEKMTEYALTKQDFPGDDKKDAGAASRKNQAKRKTSETFGTPYDIQTDIGRCGVKINQALIKSRKQCPVAHQNQPEKQQDEDHGERIPDAPPSLALFTGWLDGLKDVSKYFFPSLKPVQ
jgi:hypothetical protein